MNKTQRIVAAIASALAVFVIGSIFEMVNKREASSWYIFHILLYCGRKMVPTCMFVIFGAGFSTINFFILRSVQKRIWLHAVWGIVVFIEAGLLVFIMPH